MTIKCSAIGGPPTPEIRWTPLDRDETISSETTILNDEMVETTSYLTFVPLKDDHNMSIECEAINDVMAEPITTEENLDIYCKIFSS